MNKNRIMIAVMLALSLGVVEPVFAAEQPKPSLVKRAEAEYKQFIDALKCWRGFRWKQCTPAQRKRVLISGAVLVTLLAGLAFISGAGVSAWKKREAGTKISIDPSESIIPSVIAQEVAKKTEERRAKEGSMSEEERKEFEELLSDILLRRASALDALSRIELEQLRPLAPDRMKYHKDRLESAIEMNNYGEVILSMESLYDYRGIVINLADSDGNTLLHRAVNLGTFRSVAALIASGVDMNPKNKAHQTPLDFAGEDIQISRMLKAAGAVHGSELR